MVEIIFEGVVQRFHERCIFSGLSHTLEGGRITAVTGPNGSGKSTFLKLAAHLLLPSEGKVIVRADDKELKREELRMRLAAVTPELRFYPRLTAMENLQFLLGLRGKKYTASDYEKLLERVDLDVKAIENVYAGQFSTGMRQRLKFAALLASEADIWLLDEPAANLDEKGRAMIADEARKAAGRGTLVLWATNESREEEIADERIDLARYSARL